MTDSRINLHGCHGLDPATQTTILNAYSGLLEHELSGAEGLIAVYHAWQDIMLHCTRWLMLGDTEDADRMAWSLVTKLKEGPVVTARSIPGYLNDGHILHDSLEPAEIFLRLSQ
jgi:hypothetical protein